MKLTPAAKVGLFTLIGAALFIYIALFLNHVTLFAPPQNTIVGQFENVTGLKEGNTIRYSGVPIGKVKDIAVGTDGVTVTMKVDSKHKIPTDSKFSIQTDGILGEKFVSIEPGKSRELLHNGSHIDGISKSNVDEAVGQMNKVLVQAEKLLGSINAIVGTKETKSDFQAAISNANQLTYNLVLATSQMNTLMQRNTSNIDSIANNMVALSQNMANITNQMDKTLKNLDGKGESSENLKEILKNLKETTANLNELTKNVNKVAADQQVLNDVKTTIHNTAILTSKLTGEGPHKGEGGSNIFDISAGASMDTLYGGISREYDSNLNLHLRVGNTLYNGGANHIGNGTTVNANIGKRVANYTYLEAGIFDGKPGFGVDYGVDRPVHLSAAIMDPNDWRYRLRAEIQFAPGLSAVAQFNRPMDGPHGGDYYGLQYNF